MYLNVCVDEILPGKHMFTFLCMPDVICMWWCFFSVSLVVYQHRYRYTSLHVCLLKHQPQHQHHLHPCLWILTLWIFTFLRLLVAFQGSRCCSLGFVFLHTFSMKQPSIYAWQQQKHKNGCHGLLLNQSMRIRNPSVKWADSFKKKQHLTSNKQQGMFPTLGSTISAIHQTPGKKNSKISCSM